MALILPRRVTLSLAALLFLHVVFYRSNDAYYRLTSPFEWFRTRHVPNTIPEYYYHPPAQQPLLPRKANAALVMLVRNFETKGAVSSIKQMEDRFNKRYQYPWVLLNEIPFTKSFRDAVSHVAGPNVTFAVINKEDWYQPKWINDTRAAASRAELKKLRVLYAESITYRNMCRFNAGFFFRQEALLPYRYYWRVEPGVKFFCDMTIDPFLFMQDNNKVYSFVMSMYEFPQTIPTLWETVKNFTKAHPEHLARDPHMKFISADGGETYNLCHFWSNFEIADMAFWRSDAYTAFFAALDATGGFYYERWGDAPVHTLAVALLANKSQLHFFDEIGYRHEPYQHCPHGDAHTRGRCECEPDWTFDHNRFSCLKHYQEILL